MKKFFLFFKLTIPFILFLILVIFFWRGLHIDPRELPSVLINKPAPQIDLPTLQNTKQLLTTKNLMGHVSLVNVWATWCEACAEEHPVLVDIAATKKIMIYGLDYKDQRNAALNWLHNYGNPYHAIGFDEDGMVAINWGVYGAPETFVIDKQGIIRYKFIGPITQVVWQNEILPIVEKLQKVS